MDLKPFLSQLEKVCRENNVARLGVFGSVARGEDKPDSDIDLLVELKKPVGLIKLIQLEDKLVKVLGRKVDLGTESSLHPLIHDAVMNDLKILYESTER
ncbi:MAG TPA: nucleotidyltransferase family protein [Pyrinomonadaceae bacterium]|nr:nucleotidyltransferase family protein [Pyrinomonadaceae bacterium]